MSGSVYSEATGSDRPSRLETRGSKESDKSNSFGNRAKSATSKSRSRKQSATESSETEDDFTPSKNFAFRFTKDQLREIKRGLTSTNIFLLNDAD